MVFDYFSFTRAKKNQEALEKTNPQNPVLNKEDEDFLDKVATHDAPAAPLPPSIATDDGGEHAAQSEDLKNTAEKAGSVALPEASESEKPALESSKSADREVSPSQKRSWTSYVPTVPSIPSVPAIPSLPTWRGTTASKSPDQSKADAGLAQSETKVDEKVDEKVSPADQNAYPAGVKVTEGVKLDEAKQEADRREMSVLLDRLSFSPINNRVFSFSQQSQKLYADFTIVLKDMMNGVPTAYDDMDKLLRDNDHQIRDMFKSMPPFVQTLVKSLPAKFGGTLGPEILAAASEKPGNDMKAKMSAASKSAPAKGKKKNVPNVKSIASEKGAVASMLRSTVTFLQTRFPTFVTGTNVIMSLAVFILMFVFWYCHKRGKEVRLQHQADAASIGEGDESEVDSSLDESEILTPESAEAGQGFDEKNGANSLAADSSAKSTQEILEQPQSAEAPMSERPDEKQVHATAA